MLYFFASSQWGKASGPSSGIGPPVFSTTLSAAVRPSGTAAQGRLGTVRSSSVIFVSHSWRRSCNPLASPLDGSHALLGLLGEVLLAGLHMAADGGSEFFELGGSAVAFLLKATALGVDFKNLGYDGFAVESFYGKASDNEVGIRLYSLKCKHLNKLLARLCGRRGFCFCFVVLYGYFYPALPGEVRMGRGNGDMREASCKEFLHLC